MKVKVEELVSVIRNLGPKFNAFHLQPCYCGAPVWMQPCPICRYYPMYGCNGSDMGRNECTKESYVKRINRVCNILEFYLKSFENCVDPQTHILNKARRDTYGWEWPTPEEIWEYYSK